MQSHRKESKISREIRIYRKASTVTTTISPEITGRAFPHKPFPAAGVRRAPGICGTCGGLISPQKMGGYIHG